MFSYDDIDCLECSVRWSCSLEADGPEFVPCDKHLKQLDGTGWNVDYVNAGVAQVAEHVIRNHEVVSSTDTTSPSFDKQLDDMQKPRQREAMDKAYHASFEQVSRCCK